jgi:hypothetical protein
MRAMRRGAVAPAAATLVAGGPMPLPRRQRQRREAAATETAHVPAGAIGGAVPADVGPHPHPPRPRPRHRRPPPPPPPPQRRWRGRAAPATAEVAHRRALRTTAMPLTNPRRRPPSRHVPPRLETTGDGPAATAAGTLIRAAVDVAIAAVQTHPLPQPPPLPPPLPPLLAAMPARPAVPRTSIMSQGGKAAGKPTVRWAAASFTGGARADADTAAPPVKRGPAGRPAGRSRPPGPTSPATARGSCT